MGREGNGDSGQGYYPGGTGVRRCRAARCLLRRAPLLVVPERLSDAPRAGHSECDRGELGSAGRDGAEHHNLFGGVPLPALRQPVVKPVHDTKPCLEIVQGLAKRLGLGQYFDYTIEQWNEAVVKELPLEMPLEYLKKHGVYTPPGGPKYGKTLNPEHRFVTQSGKIELYSERLLEAGHDPLPVYQPQPEPPTGKFRLVGGRKAVYTHASPTSNPWLFDFAPENRLWMNPLAAQSAGGAGGEVVGGGGSVGSARLRGEGTGGNRPACLFILPGFGEPSPRLKRPYNRGRRGPAPQQS